MHKDKYCGQKDNKKKNGWKAQNARMYENERIQKQMKREKVVGTIITHCDHISV